MKAFASLAPPSPPPAVTVGDLCDTCPRHPSAAPSGANDPSPCHGWGSGGGGGGRESSTIYPMVVELEAGFSTQLHDGARQSDRQGTRQGTLFVCVCFIFCSNLRGNRKHNYETFRARLAVENRDAFKLNVINALEFAFQISIHQNDVSTSDQSSTLR